MAVILLKFYYWNIIAKLGKTQDASHDNMVQNGEEIEGNPMLQGANLSLREEEEILSENVPRRRRSGKRDNIFHTRLVL